MNNEKLIERVIIIACIIFFICGLALLYDSIFHDDDPNAARTAQVMIAHFGGIAGDNSIVSIFLSIIMMGGSVLLMLRFQKRISLSGYPANRRKRSSAHKRSPTEIGKQIASLIRKKDGSTD